MVKESTGMTRAGFMGACLLLAIFILSGCSGVKTKPSAGSTATQPSGITTTQSTSPTKRGGYYLDDGPGDHPPEDIDSIPDATPKPEVILPRSSRPYIALGQRYTPMTEYAPYKQTGIASWYGKRYHGQKTSSGEIYDMYSMSGAHTILPIPSYARVTSLDNGRSVIVKINDRGPFHSDRLIDLSYAAAYKLRLLEKGSGMVEVEAIDTRPGALPYVKPSKAAVMANTSSTSASTYSASSSNSANNVSNTTAKPAANALPSGKPLNMEGPVAAVDANPAAASDTASSSAVASASASTVAATTSVNNPPDASTAQFTGTFVQVGAFKNKDNADALCKKLQAQNLTGNSGVNSLYNNGMYRVRIGPFADRADAERTALSIKQSLHVNTYVLTQP